MEPSQGNSSDFISRHEFEMTLAEIRGVLIGVSEMIPKAAADTILYEVLDKIDGLIERTGGE